MPHHLRYLAIHILRQTLETIVESFGASAAWALRRDGSVLTSSVERAGTCPDPIRASLIRSRHHQVTVILLATGNSAWMFALTREIVIVVAATRHPGRKERAMFSKLCLELREQVAAILGNGTGSSGSGWSSGSDDDSGNSGWATVPAPPTVH